MTQADTTPPAALRKMVAYATSEKGGKTFWTRIGTAFVNRDGSITVRLDALPTAGTLVLRDESPLPKAPKIT